MFYLDEEILSRNLFNLLDKKQQDVQQAMEDKWNQIHDIHLSNSEWFMIERINVQKELLADVCRNEEFSRQGSHKLIQKLEERKLVMTKSLEQNKRAKYVQLTSLGLACYKANKELKQILEDQVKQTLGPEQYHHFKKALSTDWKL